MWKRPIQQKRPGGGLYWYDQLYCGKKKDLMQSARQKLDFFVEHD